MARKKLNKSSFGSNVALIYQLHYKTDKARVAVDSQQGKKTNYVVIATGWCNGVYTWDPANKDKYEIWFNKKTPCYCVPYSDLKLVKKIYDIDVDNADFKTIDKMQMEWWKGEIENGKAHKTDRYPDYFLYWKTHKA